MMFITFLEILPGNYTQAIKLFKNPVVPEGIIIKESLWMFGRPDAFMLFEAPDEEAAGRFVVQFAEVTTPKTSLVFPIEKMSWMAHH